MNKSISLVAECLLHIVVAATTLATSGKVKYTVFVVFQNDSTLEMNVFSIFSDFADEIP